MTDPLFWPESRWRSLQAKNLLSHLRHARKSALYRSLKPPTRITAATLDKILGQLPLTSKDQLAAAGTEAHAAKPHQIAEWVCTSGTLGHPLDVPLTKRDLERLAHNESTALSLAGLSRGDLFLLAVGMDRMFVAGLAYWMGAQKIGAVCVRAGPHIAVQPAALPQLATRLSAKNAKTLVIAVPSFLLTAEAPATPLSGIVAIGEPTRSPSDLTYNPLAARLNQRFGCPIMSTYASTETCTTFAEGPLCKGGHLNPALAIVEILDESDRPAKSGQPGEVVITPLGVQGMPLIRFRTGDVAALHTARCTCGRTTPRLGPIIGRRQHLLKYRGTSIYPNTIIEALRAIPAVHDCVLIAEEQEPLSDRLSLHIHLEGTPTPTLQKSIESHLRSLLRATPELFYVDEESLKSLQQSAGRKSSRFIDRRRQTL